MNRLTENDRHWGPITFGPAGWNPWRIVLSSGKGEDEESCGCNLTAYAFGWVARLLLPQIIKPHVEMVFPGWDTETIRRLGRNYYENTDAREYGFCLSDGHLTLYLGRQTHDSTTTQSWSCFLPWTQWRMVRHTLYDNEGLPFCTESNYKDWFQFHRCCEQCPAVCFEFDDYDGERITATTRIEERQWKFGEKWCKWLSWFRKDMVRRSLDLKFSAEVGSGKGSWKGGTIGHSIEMLPGEMHEAAFRRYCEMDHERKGRKYRMTFVGRSTEPKIAVLEKKHPEPEAATAA